MGRPRATAAAASRSRRANPNPIPSFLSPLAPRAGGSSTSSPISPTDLTFVFSPGSSASPKPATRSRSSKRTPRAKPAARLPLASPRPGSPLPAAATPAPAASAAAVSSVGDLRREAASQMEALKRRLDALHSGAHTDLDASLSRASKRFKGLPGVFALCFRVSSASISHGARTSPRAAAPPPGHRPPVSPPEPPRRPGILHPMCKISISFQTQIQACQQLTDEVDKEYKNMSDSRKENTEMIKAKYKQIMAEAQSSTSRVCKVTIPEMMKSVEKAIDGLRSRYNIPMPA